MSRSARDATRFTPNTPHAYSRNPSSRGTVRGAAAPTFQSSTPSPPLPSGASNAAQYESPQQKVARLRAEHLKRRAVQLSTWDKVILRSRNMADAAHRWTIVGILVFSLLAGGLTVFSAADMILYNRRKKREFYRQYHQLWVQRHADAVAAAAAGTATETQLAIIKNEEEAEAYHKKREQGGAWARLRSAFSFKGLSKDAGGTQSWDQRKDLLDRDEATLVGSEGGDSQIIRAIDEKRRVGERALENQGYTGGPLDQMAANAAGAVAPATQQSSWFAWAKRRTDG